MKILPVGAELFHVDGRTDRHDEVNARFSKFCENVYKDKKLSVKVCKRACVGIKCEI
jgi:hypothetical protein